MEEKHSMEEEHSIEEKHMDEKRMAAETHSAAGEYRTKYEVIDALAEEILKLLEDLYQSGFDTVHDSTLNGLKKSAKLTEQYGMTYLSGLLGELEAELSARRHQTEEGKNGIASAAELYTRLNEYLYLGRQKAAYDRGLHYYTEIEVYTETEAYTETEVYTETEAEDSQQ